MQVVDDAVPAHELDAERERVAARLARLFRRPGQSAADAILRAALGAYRTEGLE